MQQDTANIVQDRSAVVARRLQELKLPLHPDISYDLETMFPRIEGWGAKRELKRKHRLVTHIEERLREVLRPGEQVLYVAKGVQYKLSEQYLMGIWASLINQTAFVLTNVRLLMLRTDSKGRPRETMWMIYYSQIERFKATWHGTVVVALRDRTKLRFTGFQKRDRMEMPRIFEQALERYRELGFDPEVSQSRENLCSFCSDRVPRLQYICSQCGGVFWQPRAVALRSLIFPSWGDFAMKHTGLAIVELLGYGLLWVFLFGVLAAAVDNPADLPEALVTVVIALLLAHVPDALLTYWVAQKGLHPRRAPERGLVAESESELTVEPRTA
ncbi:MAG: hypothetical protein WD066_16245 [Planctomycetaceae bacterium]